MSDVNYDPKTQRADPINGSKYIYNDVPEYQGDGIDTEHCGDSKCVFHDVGGQCVFETCIFKELPELHGTWTYECQICRKPFSRDPKHTRVPICHDCLRHWEDVILNNYYFTCGFCGTVQNGNRHIPDADICDKCWAKLKSIIQNCPL